MLVSPDPGMRTRTRKSATQRSREFRERNPTYHAQWKRRERASLDAYRRASAMAEATPPPIATPLMLPAPQPPACDLLEQLAALKARQAELELVLANATTAAPSRHARER